MDSSKYLLACVFFMLSCHVEQSSAPQVAAPDSTLNKSASGSAGSSTNNSTTTSTSNSAPVATSTASTPAAGGTAATSSSAVRTRPRVFIAMTGTNTLMDNAGNDSQWTYVRANLDGLWGNQAGVTPQEEAALWKKLTNHTLIGETDAVLPPLVGTGVFAMAQPYMKGITLTYDTVCAWTGDFPDWNTTTVADLTAFYVNDTQQQPQFAHVCAGFEPFDVGDLPPGAQAAFQTAPYVFIEYPATAWTINGGGDNFSVPAQQVKAAGHNFIWFNSIYTPPNANVTTGDAWLSSTQKAYADFKKLGFLGPDDMIILVDYNGQIPTVPEQVNGVAAPTLTGIAYWLLQQK